MGPTLAGHLALGKLIYFYDDTDITIEGGRELAFTEDVGKRFEAYGWHVQRVEDDNALDAMGAAIAAAQGETSRPSLIIVRTHIGYGSPNRQDTAKAHGEALEEEEVLLTKQNLGIPTEPPFYVPDEVLSHMRQVVKRGAQYEQEWQQKFAAYKQSRSSLAWHSSLRTPSQVSCRMDGMLTCRHSSWWTART
jgi:transketolase